MEELFLLRAGFSDAAQAKLTAIGGGQNDVGTLERGEPCQGSGWREVRMISPQQMFQRHPQRIAQKRHQDVRLEAGLNLMKQRPDRELALQRSEREIGRAHLLTPVTVKTRMPSSR